MKSAVYSKALLLLSTYGWLPGTPLTKTTSPTRVPSPTALLLVAVSAPIPSQQLRRKAPLQSPGVALSRFFPESPTHYIRTIITLIKFPTNASVCASCLFPLGIKIDE